MLSNIFLAAELQGLARRRRRAETFKSVRHSLVAEEIVNGWTIARKNRVTTRLKRPKRGTVFLEDRVWSMLYQMGFIYLSGERGAVLRPTDDESSPTNQLDIVAFDDEVCVVVECKSSETPKRFAAFAEPLGKLTVTREALSKTLQRQYPSRGKRHLKYAFFLSNLSLGEADLQRADQYSVAIFEPSDLEYYEALVSQIGSAARFQFLADLLPGRRIAGLELTVPSVRTRMGGYHCFTFSVSPEYLLKIAYVSHRAKGKASDIDTYQRMIKKGRLRKIREYISSDGIFPTNIVVNLKAGSFDFQRARQEDASVMDATFGWLRLKPSYKSAWIIDGQHRLFAYAGHPRAPKSVVAVLAFSGLPPSEQARLFIDINAEQRKVKQSLLQELYAELHWEAEEPEIRVRAILSKAIQALDTRSDSPFKGRILKADERRTDRRCITLTALFSALGRPGFFISQTRGGVVVGFGPLWAGSNDRTLRRTVRIVSGWFDGIRAEAETLWDLGQAKGGGLAMNDGVTVCINTLRSVLHYLEQKGHKLLQLEDEEVVNELAPYASAVGRYFASLPSEQVELFRSLRGIQGQTTGTRRVQQAVNREFADYSPPELREFLDQEKAQTNVKAFELVTEIEKILQRTVVEELKREYVSTPEDWWYSGVPMAVRKKVRERIEEAQGKTGAEADNFDLIDYRAIIQHEGNWSLFKDVVCEDGGKEKGTKWIAEVNEIRKSVMHASRGIHMPVTPEQLAYLENRLEWLRGKTSGRDEVPNSLARE